MSKPCKSCFGYGLWGMGYPNPMGPLDASDGLPTIPCPECGANKNPKTYTQTNRKQEKKKEENFTEEDYDYIQRLADALARLQALEKALYEIQTGTSECATKDSEQQ